MVHDQIVPTGFSATVVGKFDYDWAMHKDLEGERVHVYLYGTGMSEWEYLGHYTTDNDGKIQVPVAPRAVGDYIVRMVVEGDLSSATGYLTVASMEREAILFDIDGTLTLNDFEAVGDYLDTGKARNYPYASDVVNAYVALGYQVIFLTGRPYWVTETTRDWFDNSGIKPWHLRTNANSDNLLDMQTQTYKVNYINYLKNTVGLNIVRAYGNAQTDINAYAETGIDANETYIIGENAGNNGTQPLADSYEYHYYNVVLNQPVADCIAPR
jgi:phosphatidate phosphatase PAH1